MTTATGIGARLLRKEEDRLARHRRTGLAGLEHLIVLHTRSVQVPKVLRELAQPVVRPGDGRLGL